MQNKGNFIYAPSYYKSFKCIADRCRHNCCIGWEICIDEATLERYRHLDADIMSTIADCDDGACFRLTEDGRCPHLCDTGLCNIIISHGEGLLSDICREHPRFYNNIGGRIEAGLGLVCEEACRLILENDVPFSLSAADETDEASPPADKEEGGYDPTAERDRIIAMIESDGDLAEKEQALMNKYSIPKLCSVQEWAEYLLTLEILDTRWADRLRTAKEKTPIMNGGSIEKYGKYHCRLLTYFVYRHVSAAQNPDDLRARLAFSLLSAEIIRFIFEAEDESLDNLIDISRSYSSEIEYSEENTAALILEMASII